MDREEEGEEAEDRVGKKIEMSVCVEIKEEQNSDWGTWRWC